MLSQKKIVGTLRNAFPVLASEFGVKKIAIYGSYAKGKQTKRSDIDILVDLQRPLGFEFVALADRLEELLGKRVDVATFEHYKRSFHNPRYRHIAENIRKSLIYV